MSTSGRSEFKFFAGTFLKHPVEWVRKTLYWSVKMSIDDLSN